MGPIKPGDRFFRVQPRSGSKVITDTVEVARVGNRWAYINVVLGDQRWSGGRFDMETMELDGGIFTSPGRVYRTEEEYAAEARTKALWTEFRRRVDHFYTAPETLTEVQILKAADALGFRLKEE